MIRMTRRCVWCAAVLVMFGCCTLAAWGQAPSEYLAQFGYLSEYEYLWKQTSELPARTAWWEQRSNGDAVERDLGFILPRRWKDFTRVGFTWKRPDADSVKAHFLATQERGNEHVDALLTMRNRPDQPVVKIGPERFERAD